jgi:hypothetical protein
MATRRKSFMELLVPTDANMNIKKSRLSAKKRRTMRMATMMLKTTMRMVTMMLKTTMLTTTTMLKTTTPALESENHS